MRFLNPNRIVKKKERRQRTYTHKGSMAEWSKAWDSGSHPQGRGFKSLCCHQISMFLFFVVLAAHRSARARSIIARAVYAYWFVFFPRMPKLPLTTNKPETHNAHKIIHSCFPRRRDATRKKSPLFFIIVEEEEASFWLN